MTIDDGGVLDADADIWKWTDMKGDVHYVNTLKPIYTWLDEAGKVWYSDKPDHENAVSVELVWHSTGDSVEEAQATAEKQAKPHDTWAYVGETPEDRLQRENAEKYYWRARTASTPRTQGSMQMSYASRVSDRLRHSPAASV